MKRCMVAMVLLALLAGCGNVYLSGDGLTAAQQSTMDAYQAVQRADADPVGFNETTQAYTAPAAATIKSGAIGKPLPVSPVQ